MELSRNSYYLSISAIASMALSASFHTVKYSMEMVVNEPSVDISEPRKKDREAALPVSKPIPKGLINRRRP
jgi:hypothetical protein